MSFIFVPLLVLNANFAYAVDCGLVVSQTNFDQLVSSMNAGDDITANSYCRVNGSANCAQMYNACQSAIDSAFNAAQMQRSKQANVPATYKGGLVGKPEEAARTLFPGFYEPLQEYKKRCVNQYKRAKTMCNPTQSEQMANIGQQAAGIIDMLGAGAGVQMACTGMGELLKNAMAALGVFRGQCTAFKKDCDSSCGTALTKATEAAKELRKACRNIQPSQLPTLATFMSKGIASGAPEDQAVQGCDLALAYFDAEAYSTTDTANKIAAIPEDVELDGNANLEKQTTIRDGVRLCETFGTTLAKAANNGLQFMNMNMVSKQCDSSTTDDPENIAGHCQANPDAPECRSFTDLDCADPTNAKTNPTCICQSNPSDPICGALASQGRGVAGSKYDGADFSSKLDDSDFDPTANLMPGLQAIDAVPSDGGASEVGALGGPVAGGGGLGGGGGGGRPRGNGDAGYGGGGEDANVILGSGRGGGRGGGRGFAFRGNGMEGDDGDLRRYLPRAGASVDPNAEANSVRDQITGPGGPSNFDKISQRYRENRRTLLPE